MTALRDPITEADLDAYVDDQLEPARRIEVEAHLSVRPEAAARVMADLRARDELRLALAGPVSGSRSATAEAARRLERGLVRGRLLGTVRRAAALAALVAAGWLANEAVRPIGVTTVVASTPPPAYVEEAAQAHRTSIVRAAMASQPQVPGYDPEELRAATGIVMPTLPEGWRVTDVQVYPSRFGPSVEMAIQAGPLGDLSLFAVRPGTFDVVPATAVVLSDVTAAFFQIGDVAYALVAGADADALERSAVGLAATLY